jgi:cell division protein FtsL
MDFEGMKNARRATKVSTEEPLKQFWQRYGRGVLGIAVVVLIVHDIFGTHGFLVMRRTQSEIQKVQSDLDRLNKENVELEQQVKDLKTDPRLIEKIAREDLVLARPGEIIVKIPRPPAPTAGEKSKP